MEDILERADDLYTQDWMYQWELGLYEKAAKAIRSSEQARALPDPS